MGGRLKPRFQVGDRVGMLEVIEYLGAEKNHDGARIRPIHSYLCRCDCGSTRVVKQGYLRVSLASDHACEACIAAQVERRHMEKRLELEEAARIKADEKSNRNVILKSWAVPASSLKGAHK